jgi:tRNA (adenine37-N6)-methyltransferase
MKNINNMKIELSPIGMIKNERKEIVDDFWRGVVSIIEIDIDTFGSDCLAGLNTFSHLEVIFYMHKLNLSNVYKGSRHPRNNQKFPLVGIFAQRVKNRPNLLGLSRCKIISVEENRIEVQGLDAIDGSPVIDIKPWMDQFGPLGNTKQPKWSDLIMIDYYK